MKPGARRFRFVSQLVYKAIVILCAALLVPDFPIAWSQPETAPTEAAPKIPAEQLDSLVAPIALYPDPLLSQTLVASTYPLEIVQLWQWMKNNPNLKDQALADAVQKQSWDPSIQAMAAFPDVVQRMADNIAWTTDLGNAFLAQQSDVMDAVQRMRSKAQAKGNLKTSPQQKVETQTVQGGKQVIVIEQSQPDVVYVPSYDPVVVYGAPAYPYPAYAYPGYVPGMMLSFGVGMAMGAAWGGGWGYGCGWGGNDVDINFNNSFNRGDRERNPNRGDRGQGGNKWQHRPEHRGGAPYGDRKTADKFGGRTRGERPTTGNRPGGGLSASQRPSGGAGAGNRPGGGLSASQRPSGGGNRVGNRNVSSGSGGSGFGSSNNTFGGGGYDGRSARSSSSRGSSSMGSGGFSGGSRGGGGRGGGGRGGGGGRRR